jgi:hypothetical protein
MTNAEHNRNLAIAFLVHGTIHALFIIAMTVFFLIFFAAIPPQTKTDAPPLALFGFIFAFVLIFQLIFTVPSFVASYGIWKRKSWAKIAGTIGAVMAAMNFPIGTAVCVYHFWFFFGEAGKELYDNPNRTPLAFNLNVREGKSEYIPPPQPPNLWQ